MATHPCPSCGTVLAILGFTSRVCAYCSAPLKETPNGFELDGTPPIETQSEMARRDRAIAEVRNG
jgi:hypothetical protein